MTIKVRLVVLVIILVLVISGGVYLYLRMNGLIKTSADVVLGCQNSKRISAFFGSPGSHLVSYNFFGNNVSVHEILIPYLDSIQKEINDKKINYSFDDVQTFNIRSKAAGGISLHSWGIALDINPGRNPQGGGTDIPPEVIDIFRKNGFFWGGDWPGRDNDPMHFEWYGAKIYGEVLDRASNQKVLNVSTKINGAGSPNNNGAYTWILPYGGHKISALARGYQDDNFEIALTCFDQSNINISMGALPQNLAGSISGIVSLTNNYPILVPANIFLDDRFVTVSSLKGGYNIYGVHQGKHKVEARILFFPSSFVSADVAAGENLKNINIKIGR